MFCPPTQMPQTFFRDPNNPNIAYMKIDNIQGSYIPSTTYQGSQQVQSNVAFAAQYNT